MILDTLVQIVREVNPHRSAENIHRRCLKIIEEIGETAEAYLSVSSPHNYKGKTWSDVREETIDALIVLIDVALTDVGHGDPTLVLTMNRPNNDIFDTTLRMTAGVARAGQALRRYDLYDFRSCIEDALYGAISVVFSDLGDVPVDQIEQTVLAIFTAKIEKWNRGMHHYAAADDGVKC